MTDDLDTRLREALAARVDTRLGPRRDAPPFTPRSEQARAGRRPVWLFPLLAAACVAAIAAGSFGAVDLLRDGHRRPATHHSLPVTAPVQPPTTRAAPSGSTSSSHAANPHPRTHGVRLGAATISLPAGWVARDYLQYLESGSAPLEAQAWCLTPATLPVSTKPGACPLLFGTIDPSGNPVDANTEGGYRSNPEYCGQTTGNTVREQSEDRPFGGRAADWRRWEISCSSGTSFLIEQYVVPTGPGYVLFSERADSTVQTAMTEIATHSQLPAQDLPVRFYDDGYLRSIERTSAGVRIAIDRVAYEGGKVVNHNPATYTYLVSSSVWNAGTRHPVVGDLIYLASDGRQVTGLSGF